MDVVMPQNNTTEWFFTQKKYQRLFEFQKSILKSNGTKGQLFIYKKTYSGRDSFTCRVAARLVSSNNKDTYFTDMGICGVAYSGLKVL